MDTELTGRNVKVTDSLRRMADEGLTRIEKLIGSGASAHIILRSQKHAETAEVTVSGRQRTVVGLGEAPNLAVALRTALEKAEKQAIRHRKSKVEKKRQVKPVGVVLPEDSEQAASSLGMNGKPASPEKRKLSGAHVVPHQEAMAERPMTIEEAVKEAESGDRQVLIFRDPAGGLKVLHCAGDGLVRLTEVS